MKHAIFVTSDCMWLNACNGHVSKRDLEIRGTYTTVQTRNLFYGDTPT